MGLVSGPHQWCQSHPLPSEPTQHPKGGSTDPKTARGTPRPKPLTRNQLSPGKASAAQGLSGQHQDRASQLGLVPGSRDVEEEPQLSPSSRMLSGPHEVISAAPEPNQHSLTSWWIFTLCKSLLPLGCNNRTWVGLIFCDNAVAWEDCPHKGNRRARKGWRGPELALQS